MKHCLKCGINIRAGRLCQACSRYERNGGVWYEPPKYGEMIYDSDGKPICHICGMACNKLIEHTRRKHGLMSDEYRAEFGLMDSAQLTSPEYHNKMHNRAKEYDTFVKNFACVLDGTRRYSGGRKINSWSEQEKAARHNAQVSNSRKRWAKQVDMKAKGVGNHE